MWIRDRTNTGSMRTASNLLLITRKRRTSSVLSHDAFDRRSAEDYWNDSLKLTRDPAATYRPVPGEDSDEDNNNLYVPDNGNASSLLHTSPSPPDS